MDGLRIIVAASIGVISGWSAHSAGWTNGTLPLLVTVAIVLLADRLIRPKKDTAEKERQKMSVKTLSAIYCEAVDDCEKYEDRTGPLKDMYHSANGRMRGIIDAYCLLFDTTRDQAHEALKSRFKT